MADAIGTERRAERVSGAIYGTLITTGLIAALSEQEGLRADQVAHWTVVTVAVFWAAHLYARLLATRIEQGRPVRRSEARLILAENWPILRSSLAPSAILVLGWIGLLSEQTAVALALGLGLLQLLGWSALIVRRERLTPARALLVMAIAVGFGVVIIGLKVVID